MKTHWKKIINHDYINEGDLSEKNLIATIKSVALREVKNAKGKTEDMHVLDFVEKNIKPMILSAKQNFKNIESATGTPYIEDWVGKKIEIYYDPNVMFGREKVGGVRISPIAPKKPQLTKEMPAYAKAVQMMKENKMTLEVVKGHYEVSAELETEINNELNTNKDA